MNAAYLRKIQSDFIKSSDQQQAGLACLASVIRFYDGNAAIQQLYLNSGAAENGVNLLGLCEAARCEGFVANGFKANIDTLKGLEIPVILHVSKDTGNEDFVVLYGWHKNKFIVGDPQWGIVEYREDELESVWTLNTLMALEPDESFQSKRMKSQLKRKWLFKKLINRKRELIVLAVLGLVNAAVLIISAPLVLEKARDIVQLFYNQKTIASIALMFIPLILFIAVWHFRKVFVLQGEKSLNLELNTQIIESFFAQSEHAEAPPSIRANSLEKAADRLSSLVYALTSEMPFYGILFIVSLVFLSVISFWAGIAVILGAAGACGIIFLGYSKTKELYISNSDFSKQKENAPELNIDILQKIKLANNEKNVTTESIDILRSFLDTKVSLEGIKHKIDNWLVLLFAIIAISVGGLFLFFEDNISQEYWTLMGIWLFFCLLSVYKFKCMFFNFFDAKESYDLIYDQINVESSDGKKLELEDGVENVLPPKKLSIDKLEFAFSGQESIFRNIKFNAELGSITVVNGATGSGKSVLVSVLNRILQFQKGEITFDGKNWLEINNPNWRKLTSTLGQPVLFLKRTLWENIGISTKSFEYKKVISFCKEKGFDKFFKELPNGYSTPVNNLSSGQKQLVALADALYRKPGLLLLDEPFAFMDEDIMSFCLDLLHQLKNEMIIIIFTGSNKVISKSDKFFVYKMMNYNYV